MAGKKTFVAGEVLLAQDVNDFLMDQSVMNFATSAARASAIPTPTEGMTTYVQDRNQIETFDGAEYRGMSGLQLVKKQAIGSSVTSVTVTDAFNATYDAYRIIIVGGVAVTNAITVLSFPGITTQYYWGGLSIGWGGAQTVNNGNNTSSFGRVGYMTANSIQMNLELVNPFLSKYTYMNTAFIAGISGGDGGFYSGFVNNSASISSFTISSAQAMTGGTIYVYGYGT
jgi:hypothetical protein